MRKRLIFASGVAVGYVLGARAGRERFDRMVAQAHQIWENPTVQEAAGVVQANAARLFDQGRHAILDRIGAGRSANGRCADSPRSSGRFSGVRTPPSDSTARSTSGLSARERAAASARHGTLPGNSF
jgi:hypothetical protein